MKKHLWSLAALLVMAVLALGCTDTNSATKSPVSSATKSPAASRLVQQYDIVKSYPLRSGPGTEHDRKINQKATDKLGKIHYLSVDNSTTVKILQSQGDWIEIQVTQPAFLSDSHRGWVPRDAIKAGPSTDKLSGWIRYKCRVYPSPDKSSKPFGYLLPPSTVEVADDGSDWLRLIWGPVRDETTNKFFDKDFERSYIEKANFTKEDPAKWDRR